MSAYDALIFDLDGTLLDSKRDITLAVNETIARMGGKPLPEELVAGYVGSGVRDLIRRAVAGSGAGREDEALRFFKGYYLAHCLDHSRLIPGAADLVRSLHASGWRLAVLTNKSQIYTDKILMGLGVARHFGRIIGAEGGYPMKPDPAGALAAASALGSPPERTLVVGDSAVDFETARGAGMPCALYLNGFTSVAEIRLLADRAGLIFETFDELESFIRGSDGK